MNTPDSLSGEVAQHSLVYDAIHKAPLWKRSVAFGISAAVMAGCAAIEEVRHSAIGDSMAQEIELDFALPAVQRTIDADLAHTHDHAAEPLTDVTASKQEVPLGGPCRKSEAEDIQIHFAETCMAVKENGRVALVAFGMADEAPEIAGYMEAIMDDVTKGAVNVSVDVVEVTDEVSSAIEDKRENNCVNLSEKRELTSVIAEQAAPELFEEHDLIVGLSDYPVCNRGNVHGNVAEISGKHADVFWPSIVSTYDNTEEVSHHESIAYTAVHEMLHSLGLLHAGRVDFGPGAGLFALSTEAGNSPRKLIEIFHGAHVVAGGRYADIMASYAVPYTNPVTLEKLEWPEKVLVEDYESSATEVGEDWSVLTLDDARAGRFGLIRLHETVQIGDEKGEYTHNYDELAVVPRPGHEDIASAEVLLTHSNSTAVATLGYVKITDEKRGEWQFETGGRIVTWQLQKDQLRISIK